MTTQERRGKVGPDQYLRELPLVGLAGLNRVHLLCQILHHYMSGIPAAAAELPVPH